LPYGIGQAIIFLSGGFFYLFSFVSLPILSHHRLDVYHTSAHGVALVQIWDAGLKHAADGLLKIQEAARQKIAICAPSHNFVGLCLRIFATKARIDNRKKTC